MNAPGVAVAPSTLADIIPRTPVRDGVFVVGFALLTAGAAQIVIPLGFTRCQSPGKHSPYSLPAVSLAPFAVPHHRSSTSPWGRLGSLSMPGEPEAGRWLPGLLRTTSSGSFVAAFVIGALAERRQDLINDPSTPPTKPFYGAV